ncbi:replication protein [Serratia fonticola]|nr:replication protein [Serratia fonticola]
MIKIYGQRWIAKNGNQPSDLWTVQVNSMTSEQLNRVCSALADKWRAGSHWPPDLAEFVSIVAECSGGVFGLTVEDVMAENKRWRNEFYRYSCAEKFPWRHPVLYHICIALKRIGIERKLTEGELRTQAVKQLAHWEKRVAGGFPIPPIRRILEAPKAPPGPTPAELAYEQYKRKKNLG